MMEKWNVLVRAVNSIDRIETRTIISILFKTSIQLYPNRRILNIGITFAAVVTVSQVLFRVQPNGIAGRPETPNSRVAPPALR